MTRAGTEHTRSISSGKRKPRGRGLRTSTGCITCRKRHVKCGEEKPTCRQCSRNKKNCHYSDVARSSEKDGERSFQDPTVGVLITSETDNPDALNEISLQQIYESPDLRLPNNEPSFPTQQPTFNFTSPASCGTASGEPPIGVATQRWFGMLAGDANIELSQLSARGEWLHDPQSVSQHEHEPVNGPQQSERDVSFLAAFSPRVSYLPQTDPPSSKLPWQSSEPIRLEQNARSIFASFVTHISQWIDLFDPLKHFSSLVPRLALHNNGLMNAILALSIRHKSLSRSHDPNELPYARDDALQYYHETLQYVSRAMQYESYHTSLELLATTLIISAYEMLDGSSRDWERHLQGVFWIQRSQVIHGDSGGLRGAIWWAWLCQDLWAAFRDKRRVFTFWKPDRALKDLNPTELAARSVFILGKVVNFCVKDDSHHDLTAVITAKMEMIKSLSFLLDEWESLLTPEFTPLPYEDTTSSIFPRQWIYPPLFGVSVQIHHAARLLILLNQPRLGGIDESIKRQASLNKHIDMIGGIALTLSDYSSSIMSSQCLFISGLCTHDQQRRTEILRLIQECRNRTGWPVEPLDQELRTYWEEPLDV